jgi:transcriptional regulator with XRE-family HTH domain
MNAEIRRIVAERLRQERARLDLSQGDMAAAGGISLRTQAAWEKGEQSPNADYLVSVSARGVDVLFVLTGRYQWEQPVGGSTLSADEQALVKGFNSLSEKAKATIRDLVVMLTGK